MDIEQDPRKYGIQSLPPPRKYRPEGIPLHWQGQQQLRGRQRRRRVTRREGRWTAVAAKLVCERGVVCDCEPIFIEEV